MQQRYYDPAIGRFLSVDPVGADPSSGANFNRYWYANDNPYKFTDPDGRLAFLVPVAIVAWRAYSAYDTVSSAAGNISTLSSASASTGDKVAAGAELAGSLIGGRAGRQAAGTAARAVNDAKRLPDSAPVCRGGTCSADQFRSGTGVTVDADGNLQNVSVNSAPGASVTELSQGIRNNQVGVTTVGDVRQAGGDVVPSPSANNPNHCTMCGITPEKAEELFRPTIPNPSKRGN